jgi:hypothetical protein
MYSTSVLLRKGHRIRVAVAGAGASLFEKPRIIDCHKTIMMAAMEVPATVFEMSQKSQPTIQPALPNFTAPTA